MPLKSDFLIHFSLLAEGKNSHGFPICMLRVKSRFEEIASVKVDLQTIFFIYPTVAIFFIHSTIFMAQYSKEDGKVPRKGMNVTASVSPSLQSCLCLLVIHLLQVQFPMLKITLL